ncbi:MAG: helix-turn-helix domain-containing protein [Paludibacteraceae bacterium]|nr:helix-turn-helix domain-containing protein [Paludibacteraceae bacterium]
MSRQPAATSRAKSGPARMHGTPAATCTARQLTPTRRLLISLILLLLPMHMAAFGDLMFSHFGVEQGLSQVSVNSIYQDETGTMWFATRQGLTRYNGSRSEVLSVASDGLLHDLIQKVDGDRNGHVYIVTERGVNVYDLRTESLSVLTPQPVTGLHCSRSGIWLGLHNRVMHMDSIGAEQHTIVQLPESQAVINAICEAASGNLYIGTAAHGAYLVDTQGKIRRLSDIESRVTKIYEDSHHAIWIGTWHDGVVCIASDGTQTVYTAPLLSSEFVRTVVEDLKGNLWIGTKNGLDCMSPNGSVRHYQPNQNPNSLSNESVWSLLRDSQGNIWVGTYFGGVDYFNPETDNYHFHFVQNNARRTPVIDAIIEGSDGLWYLCTEGWGLYVYNPETQECLTYNTANDHSQGLRSDNIKSAFHDTLTDELWLGTYLGGLSCFNPRTHKFRHYAVGHDWMQGNHVCGILPYDADRLIVGTYNGIYQLNKRTGQTQLLDESLNRVIDYCTDMIYDRQGRLWIGGRELVCYNLQTARIKRYATQNGEARFAGNQITSMLNDDQDRIWIGTDGAGLFRLDQTTDSLVQISVERNRLQSNFVSNLAQTPLGYILVTTNRGFSLINTDNDSVRNYTTDNGFPLSSLFNGGLCVLRSGEILLAGMDGLVTFREENLKTVRHDVSLHLDRLTVNNTLIHPGDATHLLTQSLDYTDQLSLSARQNMFAIDISTNNFINTSRPHIRYRLQGLSDAWIELADGKTELRFMALRPGRYTLRIEAISEVDGSLLSARQLDIHIRPPFYATWWAFVIYALLATTLIVAAFGFVRSRERLRARIRLEQQQARQTEEDSKSRLRFFTNVSHEFRTPLTLIAGQMDMLLQQGNIQPTVYNRILGMRRNVVNMQSLINELLEFRKVEQGYLTLHVSEHDMVAFAHEVYLSFADYAKARNIDYRFVCEEERLPMWFDEVQMQKVLYNLISNAFKFTPQGAGITLSIQTTAEEVILQVADTGIGIKADDIRRIFDRFYQAENGTQLSQVSPGTGIGLSLTKSIVELHRGTIEVDSRPHQGSIFSVTLKRGKEHLEHAEHVEIVDAEKNTYQPQEEDTRFVEQLSAERDTSQPKPKILIAEDNDELRAMLQTLFSPLYDVTTAVDGQDGYEKVFDLQPDIILSDQMMPRLNGSDLCARLKANIETCHIPFVLLTAWTAAEYAIEGLRKGADDYISKPFNARVLITRCNNLINNRRMLQQRFGSMAEVKPDMLANNPLDQELMNKINNVIEQNLDNADFQIPILCREVGMGRTTLFAKLKGITGQTPNEYLVTYRLKRAAHLLRTNQALNISEIAYATGFGTPKYFAKCFNKQFGKSPSEFRKSEKP